MGCITAEITLLNGKVKVEASNLNDLKASAEQIGKSIFFSLQRISSASVDVYDQTQRLSIRASLMPSSIKASISLICSTDISRLYLEIEPEILWVYPDFDNYNNVYSNTQWVVN